MPLSAPARWFACYAPVELENDSFDLGVVSLQAADVHESPAYPMTRIRSPSHSKTRSAFQRLLAHPWNQGRPHRPEQRAKQLDRFLLTVAEHRKSSERELQLGERQRQRLELEPTVPADRRRMDSFGC